GVDPGCRLPDRHRRRAGGPGIRRPAPVVVPGFSFSGSGTCFEWGREGGGGREGDAVCRGQGQAGEGRRVKDATRGVRGRPLQEGGRPAARGEDEGAETE